MNKRIPISILTGTVFSVMKMQGYGYLYKIRSGLIIVGNVIARSEAMTDRITAYAKKKALQE
jgi:hypothetical protein